MEQGAKGIIEKLVDSDEPSIRYKVLVNVLDADPASRDIRNLQEEIKQSPRVRKLLSNLDKSGRIIGTRSVYDKWQGDIGF